VGTVFCHWGEVRVDVDVRRCWKLMEFCDVCGICIVYVGVCKTCRKWKKAAGVLERSSSSRVFLLLKIL